MGMPPETILYLPLKQFRQTSNCPESKHHKFQFQKSGYFVCISSKRDIDTMEYPVEL